MPLYEFKCEDCGEVFETFARVFVDTDGNDLSVSPTCPKCESIKTKKQISACTFHLKGSGWAADGYSKK